MIIQTVYIISIVLDQMSLADSRKYNVKDSRIKGINYMLQMIVLRTFIFCSNQVNF